MRLFLAIELPDDVRTHLRLLQDSLQPHLETAGMTRDAALHVTLRFLGETDPAQLDAINESFATVTGGPLELHAEGIECFPERGPVRIVAVGFGGDLKRLKAVHDAVEQRSVFLGFRREDRPYKPHVTLARARPVLSPAVRRLATEKTAPAWPGPTFVVGGFALFQSRLTPQGACYTKLREFPLR